MTTDIVTKSSRFYCVSLTPDICKTPVGNGTPPLPYNVIGEFSEATAVSANVKARSKPVILHQRSIIPTVKGDEAGTAGGVKSGTVGKQVDTKSASKKHRANGVDLVQTGREVWMNSRNTIGKIFERGVEAARPTLSAIAQEYKDKHSADAHELGAYLIDKGGEAAGKGAVTAAGGAVLTATGALAPVGIPMAAAGTAVTTGGGLAMAGGAALDGAATVLDQTADYVLTGESPGFLAAAEKYALTTGVSLAEGIAFRRLGGAGTWLKKWLDGKIGPRLKKLTDKKAGKKPSPDAPKPPPKGDNEGKVKGAKKDKKNDVPSDCCPKDKGPANKSAKGRKPVHFGTGQEILHQTDFVIDAAIPIDWTRCYRSGAECEDWGPFGARWASAYTTSISLVDSGIVYHNDSGRALRLPWLAPGQSHDSRKEGFSLARGDNDDFTLTWRDGSTDRFELAGMGILPHGYDGVNMMLLPTWPLETQRYLLVSSAGRDKRGLKIEHMPAPKHGEVMLRVTSDDGLCVEAIRDNTRAAASGKDAHSSPARIGKVEQVMVDGKRICHVTYAYEAESETATGADTPRLSLPRRYNLVRQTNLLGDSRTYTYQHHLMTACTTYTGFTQTITWISLAALRAKWSGMTIDEVQLSELHPITLDNSYQARAIATHAADDSEHVDIAYLDVNTTRVTDACGALDYVFDANWLITDVKRVTNGVGRSLGKREWDDDGMLLAETTLAGTTRFAYDAAGNLIRSVDALGNKTSIDYDEHNHPVAVTDALGNVTRRSYDAAGRLATITDALGHTTAYKYDEHGWLVELVDAKGGTKKISYDSAGRVRAYTDCSGYTTSYRYDEHGRLAVLADALEQETHYAYDSIGRLVCLTQPDQTRSLFDYDADGRLTTQTDANGNKTRYRYNSQSLPVERIDANGNSLQYRYDGALQLVELINANGESYRLSYTPDGDLASETGFDGKVTIYTYDRQGQLCASECGGQRIELGRNSLGQLLTKRSADGVVRFDYDELGRLTVLSANQAEHRFVYNAIGQLLEERVAYFLTIQTTNSARNSTRTPDASFVTSYGYDELGNRIQTTLPNGQRIDTLRYGSGHWHSTLWQGQALVDVERDILHRERGRQLGLGQKRLSATRSYDRQSRLTLMVLKPNDESTPDLRLVERRFSHDPVGNVIGIGQGRNIRGQRLDRLEYEYDHAGNLIKAFQPNLIEIFIPDPEGNLVGSSAQNFVSNVPVPSGNSSTPSLNSVGGNRIKNCRDASYTYDTQGNITGKKFNIVNHDDSWDELDLFYDAENRLVQAIRSARSRCHRAQYLYDGFGRRIAKDVIEQSWSNDCIAKKLTDIKTTSHRALFVWDGDTMVQEIHNAQTITHIYEPDSFTPLARIDSTGDLKASKSETTFDHIHYFNCDQIGTPRELISANGEIVWDLQTTAWGKPITGPSSTYSIRSHQAIRFQGQYEDVETGLFYNRYRYYDPDTGRYITQDPIGLLGGLNPYAYAPNPIAWTDPRGLKSCSKNKPCNPCDGRDPAAEASKWQGGPVNEPYIGKDVYTNVVVSKGTILYALYPHGTKAGNFHVRASIVLSAKDARDYNDSLQVAHKGNWTDDRARPMRTHVDANIVTEDTCMAMGKASNNPHLGKGGGIQYFIENRDKKNLASLPTVLKLGK